MAIDKEILDKLMEGIDSSQDLVGPEGLLNKLTGALVSRALEGEMSDHLGYEKGDPAGNGTGNSRNGSGSKTAFCLNTR